MTPNVAPAALASPLALAYELQSSWLAQMAGWQSAWMASALEVQRQVLQQDWTAQAPWLRWAVWHNGTEQLA